MVEKTPTPFSASNVMVPKQRFETRRPVLPSVAYSMAYSFVVSNMFSWRQGVSKSHSEVLMTDPRIRSERYMLPPFRLRGRGLWDLQAERPSVAADDSGFGCPRSLNQRTTE